MINHILNARRNNLRKISFELVAPINNIGIDGNDLSGPVFRDEENQDHERGNRAASVQENPDYHVFESAPIASSADLFAFLQQGELGRMFLEEQ